ncbi:5914_t:CDS:1 [Dentiscutata heterogama]|uniref:5914_t:CDS:1 n=1 Tax=Dentiscutata heterogama TaxID=1316150 RepID=A0ACA9M4I9_9GLOM|nr:5914_t:CDS:1 [Dentiscutata heterogama]
MNDKNDQDHMKLLFDIISGLHPKLISGTPKCYVDVMIRCWDADPLKRPSSTELLSIITAWNNRSRDENQFKSVDIKTQGFKKRQRQYFGLNSSQSLEIMHLNYISIKNLKHPKLAKTNETERSLNFVSVVTKSYTNAFKYIAD